jgi:hypothetical protein
MGSGLDLPGFTEKVISAKAGLQLLGLFPETMGLPGQPLLERSDMLDPISFPQHVTPPQCQRVHTRR